MTWKLDLRAQLALALRHSIFGCQHPKQHRNHHNKHPTFPWVCVYWKTLITDSISLAAIGLFNFLCLYRFNFGKLDMFRNASIFSRLSIVLGQNCWLSIQPFMTIYISTISWNTLFFLPWFYLLSSHIF